jgi:hypothetical protein
MAEVKVELKPDKTSSKTGNTTGMTRARARRVKTARKDGLERLRQGADRELSRNWKTLMTRVREKAEGGDLGHIKLLVTLSQRKKPREVPLKKARGISLAQRLDQQPEWQGKPLPEV